MAGSIRRLGSCAGWIGEGGVLRCEVVASGKERAGLAARGRAVEGRCRREASTGGRQRGGEGRHASPG